MNEKRPHLSVIDPSRCGRQKYGLTAVPYLPGVQGVILLDGRNLELAADDVMLVNEIIREAHGFNKDIPLCRVFSDDICFHASPALDPQLFTHLCVTETAGGVCSLILHYYIALPNSDCVFGDVAYGENGEIARYTVVVEHDGGVSFVNCEGSGEGLGIIRAEFMPSKRRKRNYPLIIIEHKAVNLLVSALIMIAALAAVMYYFVNYSGFISKNALIMPDQTEAAETASYAQVPAVYVAGENGNADDTEAETAYSEASPPANAVETDSPANAANSVETTASETVSPEAVAQEDASTDTVASEAVASETIPLETVAPETAPPETAPPETIAPETAAPETIPPETTAVKVEPVAEPTDSAISNEDALISLTKTVSPGETASISLQLLPNTSYSISVYYSSGKSKASGLEDTVSDGAGNISWSWKVGTRTKAGTYKIVINGKNDSYEYMFTITE